MSEQQPELRWAPIPPAPKNRGKVWLIVVLVVLALAIVGALLFFLLPRGGAVDPDPSASPSPSATATRTPTPTPTPTPTSVPTPTPTPEPTPDDTPPPATDPTLETFRGQVGGWLGDAQTGLGIVAGTSGQDALAVLDSLQEDAQRLADAQPPASIDAQWRDGVAGYAAQLQDVRDAVSVGTDAGGAIDLARQSVTALQGLVGA